MSKKSNIVKLKLPKAERKAERKRLERERDELREASVLVAKQRDEQKHIIIMAALAWDTARANSDIVAFLRAEADLVEAIRDLK